jgi:hypothetical protein
MVRFINGSPDAGNIDVLIQGKVVASNIAYGSITAFQSETVGTSPLPQVAFVKTGTQTNIFPAISGAQAQTFQLGAAVGSKVTVVVEGRATLIGSLGLAVGAFIEPTLTVSSGSYAVVFHHASPAASLSSPNGIYVGQVALGPSPTYTVLGSMLFSSTNGTVNSLVGVNNQPAFIGPPGVGFWAGPVVIATATPIPVTSTTATPTPTPSASVTPIPSPSVYAITVPGPPAVIPSPAGDSFAVNGVDPSNVNQSMPDGSNNILYMYLIDSTSSGTGTEMVGTFSN